MCGGGCSVPPGDGVRPLPNLSCPYPSIRMQFHWMLDQDPQHQLIYFGLIVKASLGLRFSSSFSLVCLPAVAGSSRCMPPPAWEQPGRPPRACLPPIPSPCRAAPGALASTRSNSAQRGCGPTTGALLGETETCT